MTKIYGIEVKWHDDYAGEVNEEFSDYGRKLLEVVATSKDAALKYVKGLREQRTNWACYDFSEAIFDVDRENGRMLRLESLGGYAYEMFITYEVVEMEVIEEGP